MDIAAWLRGLGLEQYVPAFHDNDVDGEILPELSAKDLISIGVTSVGYRRKLLSAIAALGAAAPQRFTHSRAVGAHVGLTPKRYQSGETDYDGGVSKCGDAPLRTMLYEAAQVLLTHGSKWSWLKAWGMRVAQRRGIRRAIVAVARRLAVVLHRMWATVASSAGARTVPPHLRLSDPAQSAGKLSARR
jgi:SAM domain (Sterile alpha motif)/Transposase IS116/IS110/IS902 family